MGYCDGLCPYSDDKKHKCKQSGKKLEYMKGWWGVTHEHLGFADCDNPNLTCITGLPCSYQKDINGVKYCIKSEGDCEFQLLAKS